MKELYLAGDLDQVEYQACLPMELVVLPNASDSDSVVGEQQAAFLTDVPAACTAATPAEHNWLARDLVSTVVVANRTAVAVAPQPYLCPFFEKLSMPEGDLRNRRKRRGSVAC